MRVATGREIDISAPSLAGAGALRLTTFGAPAFCLSSKQIFNNKKFSKKKVLNQSNSTLPSSIFSGFTHFSSTVDRFDSVRVI